MDNVALDVIIGLVFIYLLFSILLTSLSEFLLNHWRGLRGQNLNVAIKSAFGATDGNDTTADAFTDRFFSHGLIASLQEGDRTPSEIPADMFSKVFLSVLGGYSGATDRPATPAEFLNKLKRDNNLPNRERIIQSLEPLLPGGEVSWEAYERSVANWFAQIGDRSKGWYKRKLDRRIFFIALGLATICNVDTVFIVRMLQLDQQHRELLATQAANVIAQADGKTPSPVPALKTPAVQRMELRDAIDAKLVGAQISLRDSILDSEALRTALFGRCQKKESCDSNPYKWYEELDRIRQESWKALNPASSAGYATSPPELAKLADDLRTLSSNLWLAYPDPVRKEDAAIKKHLTTLRPTVDEAARLMQRQIDTSDALAPELRRICGNKDAAPNSGRRDGGPSAKQECIERFQMAATGKLGFPIGWSADLREFQRESANRNFEWQWAHDAFGLWLSWENIAGLLLTTLALMLGAPFWFDVLRKVVSLRTSGPRRDDGLSAGNNTPPKGESSTTGNNSSPGGGTSPGTGGWFSDAVNDVERRLSAEQIRQLQSRLEVVPISGRLDSPTRDKIFAWRQSHRGGAEPSWELDEAMVRELLWQTPDPLQRDPGLLPSATALPASDGPLPDLKLGNQGPEVPRLRGLLAAAGYTEAAVSTGETFDADLDKAVKAFQADKNLGRDGVVGPITWLKLTNDPEKLPPAFSTPPWMRYAIHEIGITELAGGIISNFRIEEYQHSIGATPDDEIPWCSAFANWVMAQVGIRGSGKAVASSWRDWGIDTPSRYGAVVVLLQAGRADPGTDRPGAHVAFLVRETSDRYIVLGGNQGKEGAGSVCLSAFPKGSWRHIALRWPSAEQLAKATPPVKTAGAGSLNGPPSDKSPLTAEDITQVIKSSGVELEPALVEAVLEVESSGRGFIDGNPVVRLEGHVLWDYARNLGVNTADWTKLEYSHLMHREPTNRFARRGNAEWQRLAEARELCRKMLPHGIPNNTFGVKAAEDLANLATSWGLFQIMGYNWKLCGQDSPEKFVTAMSESEAKQLELFFAYLKRRDGALDALKLKQWAEFARIYNGRDYRSNSYDTKLERAYERARSRTNVSS
ncbi:MAG: TIGR02594 family protein [Zoogloeaceae bacterium]|nr:TIGR02594 family protein [Zoogloeaceae bacterium]